MGWDFPRASKQDGVGCAQVPASGEERAGPGPGTSLMELLMAGWAGSPQPGGPARHPSAPSAVPTHPRTLLFRMLVRLSQLELPSLRDRGLQRHLVTLCEGGNAAAGSPARSQGPDYPPPDLASTAPSGIRFLIS